MKSTFMSAVIGWGIMSLAGVSPVAAEEEKWVAVNASTLQCRLVNPPYRDPHLKAFLGNERFPLDQSIYRHVRLKHQSATAASCDPAQIAELRGQAAEQYFHLFAKVKVDLKRQYEQCAYTHSGYRTWLEETVTVTLDPSGAHGLPLVLTSKAYGEVSDEECR